MMKENEVARGRELFWRLQPLLSLAEGTITRLPTRVQLAALHWLSPKGGMLARAIRYALIRSLAESCGEIVDVRRNVELLRPDRARLGSRISIHPFTYIDATGGLSIGDDVSIAHGVSILTTEHNFSSMHVPIRDQGVSEAPVEIDSDVWIGAGARILSGVSIGTGSIIAAGAVVTKDVAKHSVVAGVPAAVIRRR